MNTSLDSHAVRGTLPVKTNIQKYTEVLERITKDGRLDEANREVPQNCHIKHICPITWVQIFTISGIRTCAGCGTTISNWKLYHWTTKLNAERQLNL